MVKAWILHKVRPTISPYFVFKHSRPTQQHKLYETVTQQLPYLQLWPTNKV